MQKQTTHLPQLQNEAQTHTKSVLNMLLTRIQSEGPLSFADYMQTVLYEPGFGYYAAGSEKFGAAGDFVTAPEISPIFAQCLARQFLCIAANIPHASILEFGAGSGQLACDILLTLQQEKALPEFYYIVEVSPDLIQRQQHKLQHHLPEYFDHIIWCSSLPENFEGMMLANEVLDAMPVHLIQWKEGELTERAIDSHNDQIRPIQTLITHPTLKKTCENLQSEYAIDTDDYETEINLCITPWLEQIANSLKRGVVIIIDYGFVGQEYYHPARNRGTLMCHFQHRAHSDPLFAPGLQDITAHVDFTAVAIAAQSVGLNVSGFTAQAYFLINTGIMDRFQMIMNEEANSAELLKHAADIKKLTLPHEMGELFKVMALSKNYDNVLNGFSAYDQLHRL